MQEFPRAEKRELKSQRVLRDAERGVAAIEVATLAIRREAATAWLARRYSAEAERLIAEQIAEADLVVVTAMAAYRAGKAPQSELIAAQTAVLELRNRATEASMQSKRARIALARYIGADADRPLGDAPDVARLPFDPRACPTSTRSRKSSSPARRSRSPQPRPTSPARRSCRTGARKSRTPSAARPTPTWCR